MRISLIFLALITTMSQLFAQDEKPADKTVSAAFIKNYNAQNYEAIFNMFSNNMKNASPLNKTVEFFNRTSALGKITNLNFERYEKNVIGVYKATFENGSRTFNLVTDAEGKIAGFIIKEYTDPALAKIERNITKMSLPFKEVWVVVWGGDTKEQNYHMAESVAQKNAFDILGVDKTGKSYRTDGKINEDYYAFGKPLFAPCDGEVILATDGVADNKPGEMNATQPFGNTAVIKTANNEYVIFAHFKRHSVAVKKGDFVKKGQLVGLCGNSGHSSEPHLHFHLQNSPNLNEGVGIKCYFEQLMVNGELKIDYSPVKGQSIGPDK